MKLLPSLRRRDPVETLKKAREIVEPKEPADPSRLDYDSLYGHYQADFDRRAELTDELVRKQYDIGRPDDVDLRTSNSGNRYDLRQGMGLIPALLLAGSIGGAAFLGGLLWKDRETSRDEINPRTFEAELMIDEDGVPQIESLKPVEDHH